MIVYLPSCKFTQACPGASRRIQAYMARQADVRVAGCCSMAVREMTAEDTAVTACMSCSAIVRETGAQGREISIWEYLAADPDFPWPDMGGEAITLQDCWRARDNSGLHVAVRECMRKMHIRIVELPENREACGFDGVWRMNPPPAAAVKRAPVFFGDVAANGLTPVPREEQPARMAAHVSQYTTERAVTYCNACLNGMKAGGANALHLMELAVMNIDA